MPKHHHPHHCYHFNHHNHHFAPQNHQKEYDTPYQHLQDNNILLLLPLTPSFTQVCTLYPTLKNVLNSVSSSFYNIYFIDALKNKQNYIHCCTVDSNPLLSLPLQASYLIPLPSALPLK